MKKIAIVGAGRVGESTAWLVAQRDWTKTLVLLDVKGKAAQGAALDIQQTQSLLNFDTRVIGGDDWSLLADAELVIVTAGFPRTPGSSRSAVLLDNLKIIDSILEQIIRYAPHSLLLMVTNPVDALTYYALEKTRWGRNRVFGQAGILDSARLATFMAQEGYAAADIQALVLGGHGDAMVPVKQGTTIAGHNPDNLVSAWPALVHRTRQGGAEILSLRGVSAYFAPAAAVAAMVESIVLDRGRILPCVTVLEGEYGEHDVAMSVPTRLGKKGMEQIIEMKLSAEDQLALKKSADFLRIDLDTVRTFQAQLGSQ